MTQTKVFNGKVYELLTRRTILVVARKLARQLEAEGKTVHVDSINPRNHDIYILKEK